MVKDWTPYHDEIRNLYLVESKPLSEVMASVEEKYGFIASARSYRTQLQKWGYMKYHTQRLTKRTRISPSATRAQQQAQQQVRVNPTVADSSILSGGVPPDVSAVSAFNFGAVEQYISIEASPAEGNTNAQDIDIDEALTSTSAVGSSQQREQNDEDSQLRNAIVREDTEQVRKLLCAGVPFHFKDIHGNYPLHIAVLCNVSEIVSLLLEFGAEVNAKDLLGRTPLHRAVSNIEIVDIGIVNALLEAGADPFVQDKKGNTLLHAALNESSDTVVDPAVIDTLLQRKCDPNIPNNIGITPFHKLLDQRQPMESAAKHILSFLKHGARVSKPFPDGRTPLQVFLVRSDGGWSACSSSHRFDDEKEIIRYFLGDWVCPSVLIPCGNSVCNNWF